MQARTDGSQSLRRTAGRRASASDAPIRLGGPRPWLAWLTAAAFLGAMPEALAAEPRDGVSQRTESAADDLDVVRRAVQTAHAAVRSEAHWLLDVSDQPSLGAGQARLVLIEFSDYQCRFCRRHLSSTMPQLLAGRIATGDLLYAFFDYPAETRHPEAFAAAVAARCAADQGAFWPMRQQLFTVLGPAQLLERAEALGLRTDAMKACLSDPQAAARVRRDVALAESLGIRGTPTFLLGYRTRESGPVSILRRIVGAQPLEVFERAIDSVLAEAAEPEAMAGMTQR